MINSKIRKKIKYNKSKRYKLLIYEYLITGGAGFID